MWLGKSVSPSLVYYVLIFIIFYSKITLFDFHIGLCLLIGLTVTPVLLRLNLLLKTHIFPERCSNGKIFYNINNLQEVNLWTFLSFFRSKDEMILNILSGKNTFVTKNTFQYQYLLTLRNNLPSIREQSLS